MFDKQSKMHGVPVSKEEAIKALGRPSAEWERSSRRLEFQKRLRPGQTELDISGIRGYGLKGGYLAYLAQSLVSPLGANTSLVSDEENRVIREEAGAETRGELEKHRVRLIELEKSPEAVSAFIADMRHWLDYIRADTPTDPSEEPIEELQALTRQANEDRESEIVILEQDIEAYTRLLETLQKS